MHAGLWPTYKIQRLINKAGDFSVLEEKKIDNFNKVFAKLRKTQKANT